MSVPMTPAAGDGSGDVRHVPVGSITIVPAWRRPLSAEHVTDLQWTAAAELPPIVLSCDMRLVDGWHRLVAAQARGDATVQVACLPPGLSDLELHAKAVSINTRHGLKLTTAQRDQAVIDLLMEGCERSNRRIAETCGVSKDRIGDKRKRAAEVKGQPGRAAGPRPGVPQGHLPAGGETRIGRDGKRYRIPHQQRESRVPATRGGWLARVARWLLLILVAPRRQRR